MPSAFDALSQLFPLRFGQAEVSVQDPAEAEPLALCLSADPWARSRQTRPAAA